MLVSVNKFKLLGNLISKSDGDLCWSIFSTWVVWNYVGHFRWFYPKHAFKIYLLLVFAAIFTIFNKYTTAADDASINWGELGETTALSVAYLAMSAFVLLEEACYVILNFLITSIGSFTSLDLLNQSTFFIFYLVPLNVVPICTHGYEANIWPRKKWTIFEDKSEADHLACGVYCGLIMATDT